MRLPYEKTCKAPIHYRLKTHAAELSVKRSRNAQHSFQQMGPASHATAPCSVRLREVRAPARFQARSTPNGQCIHPRFDLYRLLSALLPDVLAHFLPNSSAFCWRSGRAFTGRTSRLKPSILRGRHGVAGSAPHDGVRTEVGFVGREGVFGLPLVQGVAT